MWPLCIVTQRQRPSIPNSKLFISVLNSASCVFFFHNAGVVLCHRWDPGLVKLMFCYDNISLCTSPLGKNAELIWRKWKAFTLLNASLNLFNGLKKMQVFLKAFPLLLLLFLQFVICDILNLADHFLLIQHLMYYCRKSTLMFPSPGIFTGIRWRDADTFLLTLTGGGHYLVFILISSEQL